MAANLNQDRRVTVPPPGLAPASSDGSRLCWALPSPVHEGLGFRALAPDRIQGDAVIPHAFLTAQSRFTCCSSPPTCSPTRTSLAPCSTSSRPLRAAFGGGLRPALTTSARGAPPRCRSGRRNAHGRTKKLPSTTGPPTKPLDNSLPIQGEVSARRSVAAASRISWRSAWLAAKEGVQTTPKSGTPGTISARS